MTLDEAIKHCFENIEQQKSCNLLDCASEHQQLYEWLKELKEKRSLDNTLRKLGLAVLEEKRISQKISYSGHDCSYSKNRIGTQLGDYFKYWKTQEAPYAWDWDYSFEDYCADEDEGICSDCLKTLELINERKKIRRRIGSLRGVVSKRGLKLLEEEKK